MSLKVKIRALKENRCKNLYKKLNHLREERVMMLLTQQLKKTLNSSLIELKPKRLSRRKKPEDKSDMAMLVKLSNSFKRKLLKA